MSEPEDRRAWTDADLVVAARDGDKAALGEVVGRHRPTALALAGRLLSDHDLAWDVVQEATMVALVSLDRLRSADRFGAWLCGIALNLARRRRRDLCTRASVDWSPEVLTTASADEHLEAAEVAATVKRAVAELAPGQRRAILLFYWQGLTQAEVAAELGISPGAVKARLHQARAALEPKLSSLAAPWWLRVLNSSRAQGDEDMGPTEPERATFVPEEDLRLVPEIVPAEFLQQAMDTCRRALDEQTVPEHLQEWLNEDTLGRLQRLVDERQGQQ
ncbi:MAG: sigma-70 family RNA polymerase sigma factor [Actinobacteria bacterium]|nr:MAG: sigma-70 family RNA polymerase sigma factor [Actinomycetota bacterium]